MRDREHRFSSACCEVMAESTGILTAGGLAGGDADVPATLNTQGEGGGGVEG